MGGIPRLKDYKPEEHTVTETVNYCHYLLISVAGHHDCDCVHCRNARHFARRALELMEEYSARIKHGWSPILIGTGGGLIFLSNCERTVLGGVRMLLIACATLS